MKKQAVKRGRPTKLIERELTREERERALEQLSELTPPDRPPAPAYAEPTPSELCLRLSLQVNDLTVRLLSMAEHLSTLNHNSTQINGNLNSFATHINSVVNTFQARIDYVEQKQREYDEKILSAIERLEVRLREEIETRSRLEARATNAAPQQQQHPLAPQPQAQLQPQVQAQAQAQPVAMHQVVSTPVAGPNHSIAAAHLQRQSPIPSIQPGQSQIPGLPPDRRQQ